MSITASLSSTDSRQMARVAHELTTPVSLISGSLENLQESLATLVQYVEATDKYLRGADEIARLRADLRLDHRLRDTAGLLEICAEGARRLTHVVDQLRTGLPAAPQQLAGQASDLRAIIDAAVAMAAHGRLRRPLVVTECMPNHIAVSANPQSLGQVLLNVVRNAFDALEGRADARVDIEARVRKATACAAPTRALVSIRDNGPGIPADYRERIFEEGFSSKAERGGLGLGLAISREIMTSLGGSIELLSPGEGTEFLVSIPTAEVPDSGANA